VIWEPANAIHTDNPHSYYPYSYSHLLLYLYIEYIVGIIRAHEYHQHPIWNSGERVFAGRFI